MEERKGRSRRPCRRCEDDGRATTGAAGGGHEREGEKKRKIALTSLALARSWLLANSPLPTERAAIEWGPLFLFSSGGGGGRGEPEGLQGFRRRRRRRG